jgi:hypothetical protein
VGTASLGNLSSNVAISGSVNSLIVQSSLSGSLALGSTLGALSVGGDLSGTATLTSDLSTLALGNLSGTLTVGGGVLTTTASINHALSGSLNVGNDLPSLTIGGSLASTGTLTVGGTLTSLTIGGADAGTINAGNVGHINVVAAVPGSSGTFFSVNQGGVPRTIVASAGGETFAVSYDGALNPNPQASVRITHGGPSAFDLSLTSPAADWFDLSRLDAATGVTANVRNVLIEGSLLSSVTASQSAYFNLPTAAPGGILLPGDNLGIVAVRDQIAAASITAAGIEAISFTALQDTSGNLHSANSIVGSPLGRQTLLSALALNPKTGKAYAKVNAPNQPLTAVVSSTASVGVFAGSAGKKYFDPRGLLLSDQGPANSTITAAVTYVAGVHPHPFINQVAFHGDGGAIVTGLPVANISSTGTLGDIELSLGKTEVLQSITAPSIFGTINLFGGTLVGAIQTTGVSTDNQGNTHQVGADLGSINNGVPTEIDLKMGPKSQIISRGNLFSHVKVDGNFTGLIAANNDIGVQGANTRQGGITISGTGNSTGQVIALGNINADINVAGKFTGKITAEGNPSTGSGQAPSTSSGQGTDGTPQVGSGILGNINITKGLWKPGVILSGGQIGDADQNTALTLGTPANTGLIAAEQTINLATPMQVGNKPPKVGGSKGEVQSNQQALSSLWVQNLDSQKDNQNLLGLRELEQNVSRITASL